MSPKNSLTRIFALILSALVLLSTFGVSLDFHLCQGKIESFSFLGEAQKCAEMNENTPCESPYSDKSVQKKNCCSNASIYAQASFQTDIVLQLQFENIELEVSEYPIQDITLRTAEESYTWLYPPPNDCTKQSILILHQTFLI